MSLYPQRKVGGRNTGMSGPTSGLLVFYVGADILVSSFRVSYDWARRVELLSYDWARRVELRVG